MLVISNKRAILVRKKSTSNLIHPLTEESQHCQEQSLGELLKKTRESLALSLDDVSEKIRIRPIILQALETNQFEISGIPSTFIRGYIRSYANCLGIPEEKYIDFLANLTVDSIADLHSCYLSSRVEFDEDSRSGRWISIITIIVVSAILLVTTLWWWENHKLKSDSRAQVVSQYNTQQSIQKLETQISPSSISINSLSSNAIESQNTNTLPQ